MPMETNMPIGIRPIDRPTAPSGSEGISRRGDGGSSSAFSPRTHVAIQTAVDDMAGILAKISSEQTDTIEEMPQDLQKVVQNIMKQAFSMEETLSQGIGSTLESQRFFMEQLTALSRMLSQLGNLTEKGFSTDFGDDMQALLKNLKAYMVEENGNCLEPVLLNKIAFELLDTKSLQEFPEALQMLLSQMQMTGSGQMANQQGGDNASLGFLKQLVQYFMPQPASQGGESSSYMPRQMPQGQGANLFSQQPGQSQQAGTPNQTWQGPQQPGQSQQAGTPNQTWQGPQQPGQSQQAGTPNQTWQGPQQPGQSQQAGTPNQTWQGSQQPGQSQQAGTPNQTWQGSQQPGQSQQAGTPNQTWQGPQQPGQSQQAGIPNQTWGGPQQPGQSQQAGTPNQTWQGPQQPGQSQQAGTPNQTWQGSQQPGQSQQAGTPNQTWQGSQQPGQSQQAGTPNQTWQGPQQPGQSQQAGTPNQTWQGSQQPGQSQQTGTPNQTWQGSQQPGQSQQAGTPNQTWQGPQQPGQSQQAGTPNQTWGGSQQPANSSSQFSRGASQQAAQTPNGQGMGSGASDPVFNAQQRDRQAGNLQENIRNLFMRNNSQEGQHPTMAQQARAQLTRVPLQNVPQAMDAMKNLAQMLLRNTQMTEQDTVLLQNFVHGREAVMSEREARQLQTLLRICQQNIPTTVQQAAVQQNLPELPRLWAFMQLCDLAVAKQMDARQLKKAGKDVADLVSSMRHSMKGGHSSVAGQKSLNFMMPLYLGDNEKSYPSYIHVYDENAQDPYTGEWMKETWLRLCVLTDNIGAVELTCRIYDNHQLDMRLFFSSHEIAEDFRDYIPDFRKSVRGMKDLTLNEVKVGAVGERRFF